MWDVGGDSFEMFEGGADFLQEAALSLDEPDLERVLEDLGALDLSADAEPSATSVTMIDTSSN